MTKVEQPRAGCLCYIQRYCEVRRHIRQWTASRLISAAVLSVSETTSPLLYFYLVLTIQKEIAAQCFLPSFPWCFCGDWKGFVILITHSKNEWLNNRCYFKRDFFPNVKHCVPELIKS